MRVVITGGAGFVGSNLIARMIARNLNNDVIVFDNEVLGKRDFVADLDCTFVKGDIRDASAVAAVLDGADAVVHLAADTRVIPSIEAPAFNFDVNVGGSFTILEAMRAAGIKRLVNASTGGAIMGEVTPPVHEAMAPSPMSPYGASKLALEGYSSAYAASYGMNCVSLRFSNVYGPRSFHKGSVVAAFMKNVLNDQALEIYGDGSQTRDYVYVNDLCDGIIAALSADVSGPIQLGTGIPTSLLTLIETLGEVTGRSLPVIHHDFRAGEVRDTYCQIDRARAMIGYKPDTTLAEGLTATWDWFVANRERFVADRKPIGPVADIRRDDSVTTGSDMPIADDISTMNPTLAEPAPGGTASADPAAKGVARGEPMAGFAERRFVEDFNALIGTDKSEEALDLLIDQLPRIGGSKLNRKEKHNHLLYASRLIQNAGNAKHGYQKLLRKVGAADDYVAGLPIPPESTFLDFGCGAHDPIAVSTYYYLNGFKRAIACDLLPPRNPAYSAIAMYDILANIALYPDRYIREGTDVARFNARLKQFRPDRFAAGDFAGALEELQGIIDYRTDDLVKLDVADGELGYAVSFAVFEHVDDIDGICEWLFRKSRPGAVQYHFIDIADHRSYAPRGGFDPWSFLTEEEAPRSMNRLRKSEHLAAIARAGFEVIKEKAVQEDIPDATQAAMLPRWKDMSPEDQRTIKLHVVIRKPA